MTVSDKTQNPAVSKNGNKPAAQDGDEWVSLNAERPMYRLDHAKLPLIGYLVDYVVMPPAAEREWNAFVVKLTQPCDGLVARGEDKPRKGEIGEEVLLAANYTLDQKFKGAALNPRFTFKVRVLADKRIDLGGGRKMWTFKHLDVTPKPGVREALGILPPAGQLNATPTLPGHAVEDGEGAPF